VTVVEGRQPDWRRRGGFISKVKEWKELGVRAIFLS
jgi:hypothetical protein